MTKEQLISYLDAAYNAELAIDACYGSIRALKRQIDKLEFPHIPEQPKLRDFVPQQHTPYSIFESPLTTFYCWFGVYFVIALLMAFVNWNSIENSFDNLTPIMLFAAVISVLFTLSIPRIIVNRGRRRDCEMENHKQKEAVRQYNETVKKAYENAMSLYEEKTQIITNARSVLSSQEQYQYSLLTQLLQRRTQLYNLNYIDANFRKLLPIYQIRFYLNTGICDKLEGPEGAYAQYMQDVRTERICSSIEELKEAMLSSLSQLQSSLVTELGNMSQRLSSLTNSMDLSMHNISASLSNLHQDASFNLAHANQQLTAIKNNTELIAVNQYISQRSQGIDAYFTLYA